MGLVNQHAAVEESLEDRIRALGPWFHNLRIHGIETFNVLRGGEYLFMPSLSALNWLAGLNGNALES